MPNDVDFASKLFVSFDVACLLGFVLAQFALVPNDVNVVNISFVSFDVACLLGFEFA